MEFVKVHEMVNKFRFLMAGWSFKGVFSNASSQKVFIQGKHLIVNEKKFHLPYNKEISLYMINENFFILWSGRNSLYHYRLYISENGEVLTKVDGYPTHINKNSYMLMVKSFTPSRSEYEIKIQKISFTGGEEQIEECNYYSTFNDSYNLDGYFLLHFNGDKITVYVEKESFKEDFNIDISYYFIPEPETPKITQENFLVKFQDREISLSVTELLALKSAFINDQLSTTEKIYLDLEYSEFENKSLKFYQYIKSYILTESTKKDLISRIVNIL